MPVLILNTSYLSPSTMKELFALLKEEQDECDPGSIGYVHLQAAMDELAAVVRAHDGTELK